MKIITWCNRIPEFEMLKPGTLLCYPKQRFGGTFPHVYVRGIQIHSPYERFPKSKVAVVIKCCMLSERNSIDVCPSPHVLALLDNKLVYVIVNSYITYYVSSQ